MLPAINRLSLRFLKSQFESSLALNRHLTHLKVIRVANKFDYPRFCFLTTKKICPLSVDRHAQKRILSHVIFENLSRIHPFDYLIISKQNLQKLDLPHQKQAFDELLQYLTR